MIGRRRDDFPPDHDSPEAKMARARHPGYSYCFRCGMPWALVKGHATNYEFNESGLPIKGCFPLCEDCWLLLGCAEARIEYYMTMIDYWTTKECAVPEDEVHDIARAVANGG